MVLRATDGTDLTAQQSACRDADVVGTIMEDFASAVEPGGGDLQRFGFYAAISGCLDCAEGSSKASISRGMSRKPRTRRKRCSASSRAALTERWIIFPPRQHRMVAALIRTAFVHESHQPAPEAVARERREAAWGFPRPTALMEAAVHDVLAHMAFPKEHWARIGSTNPLERVNKEIKRRSHVIGIFPNRRGDRAPGRSVARRAG